MSKSDTEKLADIRKKQKQLRAREQAIISRQKEADRKKDTRRKIIIGGIWLKYFPELRDIDPSDEKNFNGMVRALAELANDQNFVDWLAQHVQKGGGG